MHLAHRTDINNTYKNKRTKLYHRRYEKRILSNAIRQKITSTNTIQ